MPLSGEKINFSMKTDLKQELLRMVYRFCVLKYPALESKKGDFFTFFSHLPEQGIFQSSLK